MLRRRFLRHLNDPCGTFLHDEARPAVFHHRPGLVNLPGQVWEN